MKQFFLFVVVFCIVSVVAALFLGGGSAGSFIRSADPLKINLLLALCAAACSFIFGLITGDYSWVDRLWSTLPVVFAWLYAAKSGGSLPTYILAVIITIWGLRLSFNFARKGGYSGIEDYRWPIIKGKMPTVFAWQIFHLLFICVYQITLFVLFTLPLHTLLKAEGSGVSVAAIIFMLLMFGAILYETIADQQQWEFHQDKKGTGKGRYLEDVPRGFLSSGLFSFSRHPNYFGELSFWWFLYITCTLMAGGILHVSLIGPVLLTLLFLGSTKFTESITGSKYPAYKDYQTRTPAIIPFPRRTVKTETSETVEP